MCEKYEGLQGGVEVCALPAPFARVLARVQAVPGTVEEQVMAMWAHSLASGQEFDLSRIELLGEADAALCVDLFSFCMATGMTEGEREAAEAAFAPWALMFAPGARH